MKRHEFDAGVPAADPIVETLDFREPMCIPVARDRGGRTFDQAGCNPSAAGASGYLGNGVGWRRKFDGRRIARAQGSERQWPTSTANANSAFFKDATRARV